MFARGLAPVAIALIAVEKGIIADPAIIDIIYIVITCSIILSSLKVFQYKLTVKKLEPTDTS